MEKNQDQLVSIDINSKGYGTISKLVMQDKELSITSKAVYAYFNSFTGTGNCCFPTRKKICFDLNISNDTLSKYLKELVLNGYIQIEQVKEKGRFSHNVYTINNTKSPCPKISDTVNTDNGNLDTNNNNIKNNNILKNNNIKKERKKERTAATYEDVINQSVKDDELKDLYREYLKMRKLTKAPMTNRALQMLINKVNDIEPTNIKRQKQMLEMAIMNNWKSVYPLKDGNSKTPAKASGEFISGEITVF